MKHVGEAIHEYPIQDKKIPVIGISIWTMVQNNKALVRTVNSFKSFKIKFL